MSLATIAVRALWPACVSVGLALGAAGAGQAVNPQAAADAAFVARVDAYVALRDKVAASLGALDETRDPAEITRRSDALAAGVQRARAGAAEGDVFADVAPRVRDAVRRDWAARPERDRRGLREDIPAQTRVTVNVPYPATAALGTMPARLLQALPPLPESMEYRLAGRALVLRDRRSNVVVDVVRDVLPGGTP